MYCDTKSIQWTVVLDGSPNQGDTLCRKQAGQVWILVCQIWTGTSQFFRAQSSLSKWTLKVVDAESWQRRHFTFEDHSVSLLYPTWTSVNAYSLCPDMPCSSLGYCQQLLLMLFLPQPSKLYFTSQVGFWNWLYRIVCSVFCGAQ